MKSIVSFVLIIIATSMVIAHQENFQERTSLTPEEAARATEKWLRDSLPPLILFRNMMIYKTQSPSDRYYRLSLNERRVGDPGYREWRDLSKYDEEARSLTQRLERDPAIAKRLAELRAMGFNPYFTIYDEPWKRTLEFYLPFNPKAEVRLRKEARIAAGVRTAQESREFDERLDLYIKQRYAPDWQEWRKRFPLVEFP